MDVEHDYEAQIWRACRVCLDVESKLYHLSRNGLHEDFFSISGIQISEDDGLPQYICFICCELLRQAAAFRNKAHSTQRILNLLPGIYISRTRNIKTAPLKYLSVTVTQIISLPQVSSAEETTVIDHVGELTKIDKSETEIIDESEYSLKENVAQLCSDDDIETLKVKHRKLLLLLEKVKSKFCIDNESKNFVELVQESHSDNDIDEVDQCCEVTNNYVIEAEKASHNTININDTKRKKLYKVNGPLQCLSTFLTQDISLPQVTSAEETKFLIEHVDDSVKIDKLDIDKAIDESENFLKENVAQLCSDDDIEKLQKNRKRLQMLLKKVKTKFLENDESENIKELGISRTQNIKTVLLKGLFKTVTQVTRLPQETDSSLDHVDDSAKIDKSETDERINEDIGRPQNIETVPLIPLSTNVIQVTSIPQVSFADVTDSTRDNIDNFAKIDKLEANGTSSENSIKDVVNIDSDDDIEKLQKNLDAKRRKIFQILKKIKAKYLENKKSPHLKKPVPKSYSHDVNNDVNQSCEVTSKVNVLVKKTNKKTKNVTATKRKVTSFPQVTSAEETDFLIDRTEHVGDSAKIDESENSIREDVKIFSDDGVETLQRSLKMKRIKLLTLPEQVESGYLNHNESENLNAAKQKEFQPVTRKLGTVTDESYKLLLIKSKQYTNKNVLSTKRKATESYRDIANFVYESHTCDTSDIDEEYPFESTQIDVQPFDLPKRLKINEEGENFVATRNMEASENQYNVDRAIRCLVNNYLLNNKEQRRKEMKIIMMKKLPCALNNSEPPWVIKDLKSIIKQQRQFAEPLKNRTEEQNTTEKVTKKAKNAFNPKARPQRKIFFDMDIASLREYLININTANVYAQMLHMYVIEKYIDKTKKSNEAPALEGECSRDKNNENTREIKNSGDIEDKCSCEKKKDISNEVGILEGECSRDKNKDDTREIDKSGDIDNKCSCEKNTDTLNEASILEGECSCDKNKDDTREIDKSGDIDNKCSCEKNTNTLNEASILEGECSCDKNKDDTREIEKSGDIDNKCSCEKNTNTLNEASILEGECSCDKNKDDTREIDKSGDIDNKCSCEKNTNTLNEASILEGECSCDKNEDDTREIEQSGDIEDKCSCKETTEFNKAGDLEDESRSEVIDNEDYLTEIDEQELETVEPSRTRLHDFIKERYNRTKNGARNQEPIRDVLSFKIRKRNKIIVRRQTSISELQKSFHVEYFLTVEEQKEQMKTRAKSKQYINSEFKCEDCYKGFKYKTTFENHMKVHDPMIRGELVCEVCLLRFGCKFNLLRHQIHHKYKFTCKRCGHVFRKPVSAKHHARAHSGVKFECRLCPRVFSRYETRANHMRCCQGNVPCEICYELMTPVGMSTHRALVHKETFKCQSCQKVFNDVEALNTHARTTGWACDPDEICCTVCGEHFASQNMFISHVKEHRTTKRRLRVATKDGSSTITKDKRIVKKMRYLCDTCGGVFESVAAGRHHQRIHSDETRFECDICSKRFKYKQALKGHIERHSDRRPFKCALCPLDFNRKGNLQRHQLVHTKERPFSCDVCGGRFTARSVVKLHIQTVHMGLKPPPRKRRRRK